MRCAFFITAAGTVVSLPFLGRIAVFLVTLQWPAASLSCDAAFALRILVAAICVLSLPALWLLLLETERSISAPTFVRAPVAPLVALTFVIGFSAVVQHPPVRWFFLEAAKVRAEQFSFIRSVVCWQRDAMDYAHSQNAANLVLVGSSQMNSAVDLDLLPALLPDMRVRKSCLPGFGIMQYLMATSDLSRMNPAIVVCWISEFDAFREDRLPTNRLRFFSQSRGVLRLAQALGPKHAWQNRSELADLTMAVFVGLWRDRDLFRQLAVDFWWPAPVATETSPAMDPAAIARQRDNLRHSVRRTALLDANFNTFREFARDLSRQNVRLCVFEGSISPAATSTYDPSFRKETRERLRRMATEEGFEYVDASQMPQFTAEDFSDLYHLAPSARERFTVFLAQYIRKTSAR